jgi:hypothetical protein
MYDARFESPELIVSERQRHWQYTDVWWQVSRICRGSIPLLTLSSSSLGVIIGECATRTLPFGTHHSELTGDKKSDIAKRIIAAELSWSKAAINETDKTTRALLKIAAECCRQNPISRPKAGAVVQSIYDLLSRHSMDMLGPVDDDESAKVRVRQAIEAKRQLNEKILKPEEQKPTVSAEDERTIRSLAGTTDPYSSFLLGASIWWTMMREPSVAGVPPKGMSPPSSYFHLLGQFTLTHV